MDKATFQLLRPVILPYLFAKPLGVLISDQAIQASENAIMSFGTIHQRLNEEEKELLKQLDTDNAADLAAQNEEHYVAGFIDGIKAAIGMDPSLILKILQPVQSDKAVS